MHSHGNLRKDMLSAWHSQTTVSTDSVVHYPIPLSRASVSTFERCPEHAVPRPRAGNMIFRRAEITLSVTDDRSLTWMQLSASKRSKTTFCAYAWYCIRIWSCRRLELLSRNHLPARCTSPVAINTTSRDFKPYLGSVQNGSRY